MGDGFEGLIQPLQHLSEEEKGAQLTAAEKTKKGGRKKNKLFPLSS